MTTYAGQRIVILGLARQGVALAQYLTQAGAHVVVSDQQPAEKLQAALETLRPFPIEYALGGHPANLLDGADMLCLSGGVDINLPLAQEALRRGIALSNDSQIFLEQCPPGVMTVGITGSAGKTTTTTLVGRMLTLTPCPPAPFPLSQSAGLGEGQGGRAEVWVGGNIGHPLIGDVNRMRAGDFAVMELSSFQLEIMTRSPRVTAVLNITPNHLDRHGTMEVYLAAKAHILQHQHTDDVAVLGWDNWGARNLAVRGQTVFFSGEVEFPEGAFLRDETLIWSWAGREYAVCAVGDLQLRGRHNVLNVLAACAISGAALTRVGLEADTALERMRAGVAGFAGVEHRLEFVREVNGARWYNDSIASAPERVIAELKSFEEPIILLLGGRDKKLPWEELAALIQTRVRHTVLFGEAGPLIERALRAAQIEAERYTNCTTLAEAVHVAAQQARAGDVVLLSPGCTSFDAFKDFAERGEKFKEWVNAL